jgi:ribonuclease H2 subunit B
VLIKLAALTHELTVYRYSTEKVVEMLREKVDRLKMPSVLERSRTLVRELAREGLMEDGREDLLESAFTCPLSPLQPIDGPAKDGRTRAACELLSQYLPADIYNTLLISYECDSQLFCPFCPLLT